MKEEVIFVPRGAAEGGGSICSRRFYRRRFYGRRFYRRRFYL